MFFFNQHICTEQWYSSFFVPRFRDPLWQPTIPTTPI